MDGVMALIERCMHAWFGIKSGWFQSIDKLAA